MLILYTADTHDLPVDHLDPYEIMRRICIVRTQPAKHELDQLARPSRVYGFHPQTWARSYRAGFSALKDLDHYARVDHTDHLSDA